MTIEPTLKASRRNDTGKGAARKQRAAGRLPAVIYGQGSDAMHVTFDTAEALYLFERIPVDNTVLSIEVEGEKAPINALVRDIQVHPFRPDLLHVDLYTVQAGVKVDVSVPLHLVGTAKGVKLGGGSMQHILHEVSLRVIPSKIPSHIDVDVSNLGVGESLHVSDLVLPEGVEPAVDGSLTVCAIAGPKGGAGEAAEEEGGEAAEPEVIGRSGEGEEG